MSLNAETWGLGDSISDTLSGHWLTDATHSCVFLTAATVGRTFVFLTNYREPLP